MTVYLLALFYLIVQRIDPWAWFVMGKCPNSELQGQPNNLPLDDSLQNPNSTMFTNGHKIMNFGPVSVKLQHRKTLKPDPTNSKSTLTSDISATKIGFLDFIYFMCISVCLLVCPVPHACSSLGGPKEGIRSLVTGVAWLRAIL